MSSTRIGQSYEGAHGIWEKVSVDADHADYPEAAHLPPRQRGLYVALRARQQVLDVRMVQGGITADAYTAENDHLEALAQRYIAEPPA